LKFICDKQGQVYIDAASALTAVNHKQYHQITRGGSALAYEMTISPGSAAVDVVDVKTAPNNWCTRNGVTMAHAGWKSQLRNAGLKQSQIARYAKNMRVTLNHSMGTTTTLPVSGRQIEALNGNYVLQPYTGHSPVTPSFVPYVDTSGETIDYFNGNPITDCSVTDVILGTSTIQPFNLVDIGSPISFNILDEYHISRRNIETLETDLTPAAVSKMTNLFSTAEEASDTITEALDDTGDNRPYSDDSHMMSWGAFAVMRTPAVATTTADGGGDSTTISQTACWPDCSKTVTAPLGLLELEGLKEGDIVFVDIHAIYEM